MKTFFTLFLYVSAVAESQAYLDPGTGSILIQGLIAGIAAAALVIKTYWYRIKSFFAKDQPNDTTGEELASKQTEQQDTSR